MVRVLWLRVVLCCVVRWREASCGFRRGDGCGSLRDSCRLAHERSGQCVRSGPASGDGVRVRGRLLAAVLHRASVAGHRGPHGPADSHEQGQHHIHWATRAGARISGAPRISMPPRQGVASVPRGAQRKPRTILGALPGATSGRHARQQQSAGGRPRGGVRCTRATVATPASLPGAPPSLAQMPRREGAHGAAEQTPPPASSHAGADGSRRQSEEKEQERQASSDSTRASCGRGGGFGTGGRHAQQAGAAHPPPDHGRHGRRVQPRALHCDVGLVASHPPQLCVALVVRSVQLEPHAAAVVELGPSSEGDRAQPRTVARHLAARSGHRPHHRTAVLPTRIR